MRTHPVPTYAPPADVAAALLALVIVCDLLARYGAVPTFAYVAGGAR
jgi:hypothetical protein